MDEKIHHYEKKILKIDNEDNYLYCLAKLSKLPITVRELQNTRVFQSVKRVIKKSPDSEAGLEAQRLLKRWNAIVTAHDGLKHKDTHSEKKKERDENRHPVKQHNKEIEKDLRKESSRGGEREEVRRRRTSLLDSSTYDSTWTTNDVSSHVSNTGALFSNPSSEDENLVIETSSHFLSEQVEDIKPSVPSEKTRKCPEKSDRVSSNSHKSSSRTDSKDSRSSSEKKEKKSEKEEKTRDNSDRHHKDHHKSNGHHSSSSSKRKSTVKEVDLFDSGPGESKRSKKSDKQEKRQDKVRGKPEVEKNPIASVPVLSAEDINSSVLESTERLADAVAAPYYAIEQPSTSYKSFDPLALMIKPKPVPEQKKNSSERLEFMLSNKAKIGKVFSGKKTLANQQIPSLLRLCQNVLELNLDFIEYTGGIPYDLLRPVLEKANADQLLQIEHFNSYLLEETDELWKRLCHQQFRKQEPREFESFRDVYLRCVDEREAKLRNLTSKISTKVRQSDPVRQTKLAFIEPVAGSSSVRPPSHAKKVGSFGAAKAKQTVANSQQAEVKVIPGARERPRIRAAAPNPVAQIQRKAPLMQKTLMFMKNRFKR